MAILFYGAGSSYAGVSDAGYGDVDLAPIPPRDLLKDPFGPGNLNARRIDPTTRDYSISANGSITGMTSAQQMVELAFTSEQGSTAVLDIGNRLKTIKVISDDFVAQVNQIISSALSKAVNQGFISVDGIEVTRVGTTGASIRTRWTDLETQHQFERII